MKWEQECKDELEAILEEYFPKQAEDCNHHAAEQCDCLKKEGSQRGKALMLYAMAMSKIRKTIKAFGGCDKCWGKGYGTQTLNIHGAADPEMGEKGFDEPCPTMVFCGCNRGTQLERLLNEANITT